MGEKFLDIGFNNNFLDMTPRTQATKAQTENWSFIYIKSGNSVANISVSSVQFSPFLKPAHS